MPKIDDGGAAFPAPSVYVDENISPRCLENGESGMSLREYLIAHAPPMPQGWPTQPAAFTPRPACPFANNKDKLKQFEWWGDCLEDDQIDPATLAEFRAYKALLDEHTARQKAALLAGIAGWHASWAVAWADAALAAVLAARSK